MAVFAVIRYIVVVVVSFDGGMTWPLKKIVVLSEFAYSSLVKLPDGKVGLFYEAAGMRNIDMVRFSLAWLLDE